MYEDEFNSSPEATPKNIRKSLVDIPKRKLLDDPKNPAQNLLKMLKKSPREARPEPEKDQKSELPIVRLSKHFCSRSLSILYHDYHLFSPISVVSTLIVVH